MSTYAGSGTTTYAGLFGGGTALYGAYGTGGGGILTGLPTKYRAYELTAASGNENSAAMAIEQTQGGYGE